MIIFLAKMFKIYHSQIYDSKFNNSYPQIIYQHILTSLNRVP